LANFPTLTTSGARFEKCFGFIDEDDAWKEHSAQSKQGLDDLLCFSNPAAR
jgi:hypothetical protein